ncbi:hypothetical protein RD110_22035 [Rhodoferax koreense]|uniref:EthD domain-containing protein n=1 Tax=Rhodoferax koreensis TaxID=1842727 RepID=A0A1P8K0M6_9BURK|nr:EthD domain-containing protein [Rhodoferax koreense]APW39564.1 hypothetical protein RD110_22035 [Rhodoferax koreense]
MNTSLAQADFGARDSAIRCQTYSPVQMHPGVPRETFAAYWRDVHGPLCSRLPGLGFYVQHHFSRTIYANLWPLAPGVRRIDFPLDGAVEIGFPDADAMERFGKASPLLFGDEVNVFGWDAAYFLPNGSRTFVDKQADGIPNGPDRLHRLHVYMHAKTGVDMKAWVTGFAETLAADQAVLKLRLHLPEPYDNTNPQPPSPVDHEVRKDMLELAVMEIGFETALTARRFFESERFSATKTGQSAHIEAMAAHFVTGVYTFVRDSIPTTAGLRGSRVAEIIEAVGATNHLLGDVTRLFTRS